MNLTLVKIIISFTVGVAIGIVYEHASVVVLILLLFALYCGILLLTSKIKKLESKYVVVLIILSVICAIGVVRGELYVEPTLPSDLEGKQTFIAEVISIPEEKETTETFRIKLASSTTQLQITAPLYPTYAVGDILKITGVVKLPEVLLPTAIETTTAKSFDYKRYLHTKGIVGELVYPRIEKIDENHEGIIYKLYSIKQHSVEIINSYIPSPESALANGVLLGTDTLPKENKDAIRVASLSHITVLSGFNVAIIITVLLLVLRFLPLYIRLLISGIAIGVFVVMVGGGASLVRATLMSYVGLLAMVLGRRYDALTALFFALGIYVAYTPEAILYDVSLQLSFLATLGIIVFYSQVHIFLSRYIARESILGVLSTTIAVMICTTPFLLFTFGTFSLYGLVANLVALPLVPLLMASTFALLCTSFIPFISNVLAYISYILSKVILMLSSLIASLPYASITVSITIETMFALYAIIFGIKIYLDTEKSKNKIKVSDTDPTLVSF